MRTQINLYMVVFFTAIISTGLIAQDSIEEITVTSSYVSIVMIRLTIQSMYSVKKSWRPIQHKVWVKPSTVFWVFHLRITALPLANQSFEECPVPESKY